MTSNDGPAAVLVTTEQAAQAAHVTGRVIQNWVDRGLLTPVGQDEQGRNVFRLLDVLLVERSTRRQPRLRALLSEAAAMLTTGHPYPKPPQDHAKGQVS